MCPSTWGAHTDYRRTRGGIKENFELKADFLNHRHVAARLTNTLLTFPGHGVEHIETKAWTTVRAS
jgi:hypothetical protein